MMESNKTPLIGTIAVVAPDDVIAELEHQLGQSKSIGDEIIEQLPVLLQADPIATAMLASDSITEVELVSATFDEIDDIKQQVRLKELAGLIVVPEKLVETWDTEERFELFIPTSFSPNHTDLLKSATSKSIVDARLRRLGHVPTDIRDLLRRPRARASRLTADGKEAIDNEVARRIIPLAFMMLLWIATFTSGNYLLTTTIEEKGNKVMEVLLSAISPLQLLGGKILGQAGVSAVILGMYGSAAIAGLIAFALFDLIPIFHLVLFAIYFVMAYFMIATIMAAVGSAVTELRDAQSLMGPIMLLMIVPLAIWPILAEHPNGAIATVTSVIPPLIPFVMIIRITASTEPVMMWEIILSIVIGFASVIAMVWMCARIFRIGVLMLGKPPNLLELIRWVKQG
jgi:ABC-type Na+ efflux pump permease subunit